MIIANVLSFPFFFFCFISLSPFFSFFPFYKAKPIFDFLVEKVLIVLKEWKQLHIMTVAGLLACAFMVVPSADAVDALKTCACLLKECRYDILIG